MDNHPPSTNRPRILVANLVFCACVITVFWLVSYFYHASAEAETGQAGSLDVFFLSAKSVQRIPAGADVQCRVLQSKKGHKKFNLVLACSEITATPTAPPYPSGPTEPVVATYTKTPYSPYPPYPPIISSPAPTATSSYPPFPPYPTVIVTRVTTVTPSTPTASVP